MNNQMPAFCFLRHFQAMEKGLIFSDIIRRRPDEIKMRCQGVSLFVLQNDANAALSRVSSRGAVDVGIDNHALAESFTISSETRIRPQCSQAMIFECFLSSRTV